MSYKVAIKLYSEYRHHGSHGPKTHVVKSAAASKARAIIGSRRDASTSNSDVSSASTPGKGSKREAKAYGTHNGNVHVETILTRELSDPSTADRVLQYIDNLTSKFEAMSSFELAEAKSRYSHFKNELAIKYQSQFGDTLSEKNATAFLKELAAQSFDYTQHQIVIIIESDESFEGSHFVDESGTYVRELRTKRIYTVGRTLLTPEKRIALKSVTKDELKLTQSAHLGKGARIVVNPKTGLRTLVIDFGNLSDRVFDVDTY
jgi:hypothetical protein